METSYQFSVINLQKRDEIRQVFKQPYGAVRRKRLPGFTAALPLRQSGQSSSSKLAMGSWINDCASTSKSIFPPLRSISAPAATTRAPASSTTRMASCVEHMLVWSQREAAAQRHHAAGIAFHKECRRSPTGRILRLRQRSSYFLSDD